MTENSTKTTTDRDYYLFALRTIGDFGATIAVPVVVLVLIGQYFDERLNLTPYLTVLGFIVAAVISGKIISRKAKEYGKWYQSLVDNEAKKTTNNKDVKINQITNINKENNLDI